MMPCHKSPIRFAILLFLLCSKQANVHWGGMMIFVHLCAFLRACACLCVCVCVCVCAFLRACACLCVCVCVCLCLCLCLCVSVSVSVSLFLCLSVSLPLCLSASLPLCTRARVVCVWLALFRWLTPCLALAYLLPLQRLLELEALRLESIGAAAPGKGMQLAVKNMKGKQGAGTRQRKGNRATKAERKQRQQQQGAAHSRGPGSKGAQKQQKKQQQQKKGKKKKGRLLVRPGA